MLRVCEECGQTYEAQRSTSRFCSAQCRLRSHRAGQPLVPEGPPPPNPPASFDDVAAALGEARRVSNEFCSLSFTAPRKLRPGCARIGEAIAKAIRDEEW